MAHSLRRLCVICGLTASLALLPAAAAHAEMRNDAATPSSLAAAMAQYRRALAEYQEARAAYDAAAEAYWSLITQKRHLRAAKRANHEPLTLDDYVLTQPPVYTGPLQAERSLETGGRGASRAPRHCACRRRFSGRRPAGIQIRSAPAAKREANSNVLTPRSRSRPD